MKNWQEDLLGATAGAQCEHAVFKKVEAGAQSLGFEHCAYGQRVGCVQSSLGAPGVAGMLTLSRSSEAMSVVELASQEIKLRWSATRRRLSLVPRCLAF
jgi:hypothetical protein